MEEMLDANQFWVKNP